MCIKCILKLAQNQQAKKAQEGEPMTLKSILDAISQEPNYASVLKKGLEKLRISDNLVRKVALDTFGKHIDFDALETLVTAMVNTGMDMSAIKRRLISSHLPVQVVNYIDQIFPEIFEKKSASPATKTEEPLKEGTKLDDPNLVTAIYTPPSGSNKPKPASVEQLQEIITSLLTANSEFKRNNQDLEATNKKLNDKLDAHELARSRAVQRADELQKVVDNNAFGIKEAQAQGLRDSYLRIEADLNSIRNALALPAADLIENLVSFIKTKEVNLQTIRNTLNSQ